MARMNLTKIDDVEDLFPNYNIDGPVAQTEPDITGLHNCSGDTPQARDVFNNLTLAGEILLPLCTLITGFLIGLYIEEIVFVLRNFENHRRRSKTFVILAVYPVFAATSLLALLVPRSATINGLVCTAYFGYCLFMFTRLLPEFFGGRRRMLTCLTDAKLQLRSGPCCFCCFCFPRIDFNETRYRIMVSLVLQTAVLKPILALISAVLWTDGTYNTTEMSPQKLSFYITMTDITSTLVAVYGLMQLLNVCEEPLNIYSLRAKFFGLQSVMILTSLMNLVCSILVTTDSIACVEPFSNIDRGTRLYNTINIFLMLPLSLVGRTVYLRQVDCLDLQPHSSIEVAKRQPHIMENGGQDNPAKECAPDEARDQSGLLSVNSDVVDVEPVPDPTV